MTNNFYAALEIGTSRTIMAIGEADKNGQLQLMCHASIPSSGVLKSQITDINAATQSIVAVISEIEKSQKEQDLGVNIGNAMLAVSGPCINIDQHFGTCQIQGARVNANDINEAGCDAQNMTLPKDRERLDIVEQDFELDNIKTKNPLGMKGRILKLGSLHIHTDRNRLEDARNAAAAAHLEINEPLYAITCAADAVLDESERQNGVMVIDFGGGSTGFAVYINGFLAYTQVLGLGGDHVTNDIRHAFQLTKDQAEELKCKESTAILKQNRLSDSRISIPGSSALVASRTISRHALDIVVHARMKELVGLIRTELEKNNLLTQLHSGVVITGGGAAMHELDTLITNELGLPVRLGRLLYINGIENVKFQPAFATIAGALLYAHNNNEPYTPIKDFFKGIFK